jgi:hypothetical protein
MTAATSKDLYDLRIGDQVAVMEWDAAYRNEASAIGTIREAGPLLIVLNDGRSYSTRDGLGRGLAFGTRIRPATIRDEMALSVLAG